MPYLLQQVCLRIFYFYFYNSRLCEGSLCLKRCDTVEFICFVLRSLDKNDLQTRAPTDRFRSTYRFWFSRAFLKLCFASICAKSFFFFSSGRKCFVRTVAYRRGLQAHHLAVGSIYVRSCLTIFVFSRAHHDGIPALRCGA